MKIFCFSLMILMSVMSHATANNKTLAIKHHTRFTTLADKFYYSLYFDTLLKAYNHKTGEFLVPGDTIIIPDVDSLLLNCGFSETFKDEISLITKAGSCQTTMYSYRNEIDKIGTDSLSRRAQKGSKLLLKAIAGIEAKCDSLNYARPKSVIRQLHSAAGDLESYSNYLSGGDIYATKNINVQNLHLRLWRMYAALWCMNGYK